jgi:hypothetical protein
METNTLTQQNITYLVLHLHFVILSKKSCESRVSSRKKEEKGKRWK